MSNTDPAVKFPEDTFWRTARKAHRCDGGHDGQKRVPCNVPIASGTRYVEYLGEAPMYSSGYRYHLECAAQQGLLA